jgi:hypothetical protein
LRHEFPPSVKKAALERSGGRCEAIGPRWGHPPGIRCNADLAVTGAEHDHYPLGAHAEGSNTLENDVVCCPPCNQFAANHSDKQREQKIKNLSYDTALHAARMGRKAGLDIPDPAKPRGRQGKKKSIPRPKNYRWPAKKFQQRAKHDPSR